MDKETVLQILKYAEEAHCSEKTACEHFGYYNITLGNLKRKYSIPRKIHRGGITREKFEEIIDYCNKTGATEKEAKEHFGITFKGPLTCYKKLYNINVEKKEITKEMIVNIVEISKSEGVPEKEVCKRFGINSIYTCELPTTEVVGFSSPSNL